MLSVVRDDREEFSKYRSINKLAAWISSSLSNTGSRIVSNNSLSDEVLKRESSNCSSKGISSRKQILIGQECDLNGGLGLNELSCLLRILGIRLGFSNTWGGLGSGLALVYQVLSEARF